MSIHSRNIEAQIARNRNFALVWRMQAHDVRNIVTSLSLAAEELSQATDGRTRTLGKRVLRACDRITEVCQNAVAGPAQDDATGLNDILRNVGELGASAAGHKTKVRCYGAVAVDLGQDGASVFRILSNLVTNAVVALNAARGGLVVIRSQRQGDRTVVMVEDSGTGAAPRERGGGSGLGLLIANALAQEIGATLERLHYGADGTAFRLTLASAAANGTETGAALVPAAPGPGAV